MNSLKTLLVGLAALSTLSAPVFGASADDVKITKITASGEACKSKSNGKPDNWAYTISKDGKSFSVDFSDFILDKKNLKSNCTLELSVRFPEGTTSYRYSTQARGEAEIVSGEEGLVTTRFRLGSGRWKRTRTKLEAGTDGDFETRAASVKNSQKARCGGKTVRFTVQLSADLMDSEDSFAEVTSYDGRLSKVRVKARDCQ